MNTSEQEQQDQQQRDTRVATQATHDEPIQRPLFQSREDEDGATLQVALPGVKKEDLKLTFHQSSLKIEATRSDQVPQEWKTHRDTGGSRRYGLDVRLTSVFDGTKTTASLESGILTLHVPIREEAKPREIQVI
jgi:HSP20 family protein